MTECKNCKIRPFGAIQVTREGLCVECGARICSPGGATINVVKVPLTTCDNDHDPISFDSPFRALCPLCAMRARLTEESETVKREANEALDSSEDEMDALEKERDEAQEALDKMEQDRDSWKQLAEELQAKLDKKEQI